MKGFISIGRAATPNRRHSVRFLYGISSFRNNRFPTTTLGNDVTGTGGRTATTGFTLIELLVVVLIIGVLAAMALPDYQRAVEVSRVGAALAYSKAFRDSVDRYYMAHNRFPTSPDVLDIGLKNCPKNFGCFYGQMSEGKLSVYRQNGPFSYEIITRSSVSPYLPNTIYCAAHRSNTKGVAFCQHWGEDQTPTAPDYFRSFVQ